MANETTENKGASAKLANDFIAQMNPLRGLTKPEIEQMLENAKRGNDIRLQVAFSEIERNMPIFGVCIQKRLSGIQSKDWDILPLDESNPVAVKQAERVKKVFQQCDTKNIDGLSEAIRHLSMATFRGRAVVKPFVDENGLRFKILQNWNVLEKNNRLYWNPQPERARGLVDPESELDAISQDEVCWVKEDLPVDYPGIQVFLRQLVGEDTWAQAIERYGLAQIILKAPEGTPESVLNQWTMRAQRICQGGSGVIPGDSEVIQLTAARGQDPFTQYIEHQMEVISILSTGGTLATIGGSSGLGSSLAEVQKEQFNQLVSNDCKRISNTISEVAVRKVVEFLGYDEVLCRFSYPEHDEITVREYISMMKELKSAGVKIDMQEFKKVVGLSFIQTEDEWSPEQVMDSPEQFEVSENTDGAIEQ